MGSAGNLEQGYFPSNTGSGLDWFYEQRENLFAGPPAIHQSQGRILKEVKNQGRVRVMGQFEINDSIE
jgi:hypothetical protein